MVKLRSGKQWGEIFSLQSVALVFVIVGISRPGLSWGRVGWDGTGWSGVDGWPGICPQSTSVTQEHWDATPSRPLPPLAPGFARHFNVHRYCNMVLVSTGSHSGVA